MIARNTRLSCTSVFTVFRAGRMPKTPVGRTVLGTYSSGGFLHGSASVFTVFRTGRKPKTLSNCSVFAWLEVFRAGQLMQTLLDAVF